MPMWKKNKQQNSRFGQASGEEDLVFSTQPTSEVEAWGSANTSSERKSPEIKPWTHEHIHTCTCTHTNSNENKSSRVPKATLQERDRNMERHNEGGDKERQIYSDDAFTDCTWGFSFFFTPCHSSSSPLSFPLFSLFDFLAQFFCSVFVFWQRSGHREAVRPSSPSICWPPTLFVLLMICMMQL